MDRIIKNYIDSFWEKNSFSDSINDSKIFEHFVNYTIIDHRVEDSIDIDDLNIGDEGTIGIDGFALVIDKKLFTDYEALKEYLEMASLSSIFVEVYFTQSKTSSKFDLKEIVLFGRAVADFVSQDRKLIWSNLAKERMKLFDLIFNYSTKFKENPNCYLFYVSLGNYIGDQNQESTKSRIIEDIKRENLFYNIYFEYIDTNSLQNRYKKLGQALQKSIEFEQRITIPKINNVTESYLGIVKAKEILKLISDEESIIPNVFYDNVRDFQGENSVNKEIRDTLSTENKETFVLLNNGITIVTESIKPSRNTFTLTNYQIINGCQTSHVLYNCRELLDDTVYVSLKLVSSTDIDLTSKLIRSTNRQTAINEQDLIAFSEFQRKLEDYYKTYKGSNQLFYERRSKQFISNSVEKSRIIDKATQIKVIGSFVFEKPETSTRFFGTLFKEFKNRLFRSNDKLIVYYTAAFAFFKIQECLKKGIIPSKLKKFKFFILMMLRYELKISNVQFESKQTEKDCEEILKVLNDEIALKNVINKITEKITSITDFDLDSLETSKLKTFGDRCKSFYFPKT
ncbi:AIPR family protein [Arcicella rigui]|uniref:AIPR family protein n=1 Tax=Arcicella rigui TaxID=797020 RepID=A0ABU5QBM9_9BACT|nr:AIPR family protein [Arcicella rigui]MEA5140250.1 AIPR family protein [Arcicella rigui]